jgi:hypothetical protein
MNLFISLLVRALFACFLAVTIFVALLTTGFSGDSGANPIYIYLVISTLAYSVLGITLLFSPSNFLASGSRLAKAIPILFIISALQPLIFVGISQAITDLNKPSAVVTTRENTRDAKTNFCFTQESKDSGRLAWLEIARSESEKPQIPGYGSFTGVFERVNGKDSIAAGKTLCKYYEVTPETFIYLRAYQLTIDNSFPKLEIPTPNDVISPTLSSRANIHNRQCFGLVPEGEKSWQIMQRDCIR